LEFLHLLAELIECHDHTVMEQVDIGWLCDWSYCSLFSGSWAHFGQTSVPSGNSFIGVFFQNLPQHWQKLMKLVGIGSGSVSIIIMPD